VKRLLLFANSAVDDIINPSSHFSLKFVLFVPPTIDQITAATVVSRSLIRVESQKKETRHSKNKTKNKQIQNK
jgi:hypothetical protein